MPIRAVTFDAYGTLVRNEDLRAIPRRIVADHGLAVSVDEVLRYWVELYFEATQASPFRTLDDPAANLHWNRDEAEHNFALCCDRLTVPQDDLDAEIDMLLSQQVVSG